MSSRRELANAIRALSMDAVQKANSGHPGAPMGMADIAEVLWNDHMKHNPSNPHWADRDRFVLSDGHGSMLIYSAALQDARTSRVRLCAGCRDHHGPARSGDHQRGRHGDRGTRAGRRVQ